MRLLCEHGRASAASNAVAHGDDTVMMTATRRRRPSARVHTPLCTAAAAQQGALVLPLVEQCTLQDWRSPLPGWGDSAPPIVALGKFDALHRGHLALAMAAARLGGTPTLLSFSGMAEVLGWEQRLPLIAPCDRARVLHLWRHACGGICPRQRYIPFDQIRSLSPDAFVEVLARDLRAAGVVAGSNYRFGYRASGDAAALQSLGTAAGMQVQIVDLVGAPDGTAVDVVSSSKIREMLAVGRMEVVEQLLGRQYRLVAQVPAHSNTQQHSHECMQLPSSCLLNQPPGPGEYEVVASFHLTRAAECDLLQLEQSAEQQEAPSGNGDNHMQSDNRGSSRSSSSTCSSSDNGSGSHCSPVPVRVSCTVHVDTEGVHVPATLLEGCRRPALLVLDFHGVACQHPASNG